MMTLCRQVPELSAASFGHYTVQLHILEGTRGRFAARSSDLLWIGKPALCSVLLLQQPTPGCRSRRFGIGLHACPPVRLLLTSSAEASRC